jgi:hypothetical protein
MTEGDCSVRCRVYDESQQVVTGSRLPQTVTTEIGFYSPESGPDVDPPVEGRPDTSSIVSGMRHYEGGSGDPGQEDVRNIGGVHFAIALAMGESYMGSNGRAGTLNSLIQQGGGDSDTFRMSVRTPDVTAGSFNLTGILFVAVSEDVYAARGVLTGVTERFDFNSNPARGPIGNPAAMAGGIIGEVRSLGRARTFDQDYYGTIYFRMVGNVR